MTEAVSIGAIGFLNARPLIYGLEGREGVRLCLGLPGDLAAMLKSGEVDAALLSAIEYFRLAAGVGERARFRRVGGETRAEPTHFVALPVAAIGSRGRVGSVRLFGYKEPRELRRVLLDPASRTSNALAQILVMRQLGVRPHFVMPEEIGSSTARRPDAELVIGDRGLVARHPEALWELDLGLEWQRLTRQPFVYAFWAARSDAPIARLIALLAEARDRGLEAREALAAEAPAKHGIPADVALRYLTEQIRYTFGPKEYAGLAAFHRMAAEEGLAPEGAALRLPPGMAIR